MYHIFLAGHGNEGAEGVYLIPLWKRGIKGDLIDRAVLRGNESSVRQKISPSPLFFKEG